MATLSFPYINMMQKYYSFPVFASMILLVLVTYGSAGSLQTIPAGGTVFIGEQGLNVSAGIPAGTLISWYPASQQPGTVQASANYTVSDPVNFNVNPETFRDNQGKWYIGNTTTIAFIVADPTLDLKIFDQQTQTEVSGQTIAPGDYINFRIDSNFNVIPKQRNTTDGFLAISVRNSGGTYYSQLKQDNNTTLALVPLSVNSTPFWWVPGTSGNYGWNTGAKLQNGDNFYTDGSYSVSVDLTPLNSIRKNYDAVGKTKSIKSLALSSGPQGTGTVTTIPTATTVTTATHVTPTASIPPQPVPATATDTVSGSVQSTVAGGSGRSDAPAPESTTTKPRTTVSPGFGLLMAIAGLGMAAAVLRRNL